MTDVREQQWSRNGTSENSEDTIASRFERQVVAAPDELALVTAETLLSYQALDLQAGRIAAALASLRSGCDQPIVLFVKDAAARIAAMLGALKANRILIPLSPNSPPKWVDQVIKDSGTAQIIVDRSTRSIKDLAATRNVAVLEVDQLARSLEPSAPGRAVSPNDTAFIVYTSGSTASPKGVAISHRGVIRQTDVRYPLFGLGRSGRYANIGASGVLAEINDTFLPLLSGGSLFPFDVYREGLHKLALWLIDQKIAYISLSGSLLRAWLTSLPDDLRFPGLRFVRARSERLYAHDVIRLSRHLEGDWRIGHSYSSTEAGTIAVQIFTASHFPDDAGLVAAGRPVDGVEISILNETGAPVPQGGIGEIFVRSRFLAQGYWNNLDLTATVFQTDPLDSSIRIYQTGDLGRWRRDGTLEHVGRKGRRIRLRGYNIEPFEVESELMRQPGVTDAIVVLHEGAAVEEPCLVGYAAAPANALPFAIRKGLAERLPSYMVPSHIVVLDSFPTTSSGKIDLNALPPPRKEAHRAAFRAPANDREYVLLEIWQEVLKIPKIGVDDDFFELGGTSLQALMVFAKIETRLGCSLTPTTVVQAPTITSLAEFIGASIGTDASQSLVPLRASGTGLPLFLVHSRYCFVMSYRHLVGDLKSDRPVFGLQPRPLDGKHRIPRTIEAMAADYVSEIRRVQPQGPYFLAAHSFGGRVAFEMAQLLVGQGERVNFLGLIDTAFRGAPADLWPWISETVNLGRSVHRFQDLLFGELRIIKNAACAVLRELWIQQGHSIPYKQRPNYYDWICVRASCGYMLKPYSGHLTMFSSRGNSERQRADWEPIARGGLTVLEVPAGHDDMLLPPHSKNLAKLFDDCLDQMPY
jgi:acyl-CoA synthetase (AMP-forming)/AMP-acid ligase II/thioesterase domain-containing protein/acyl carrier protein